MENKEIKEEWAKPEIEELGNAKDLVASVNINGGGDVQFNILIPS